MTKHSLVAHLKDMGVLHSPEIASALLAVDRADFVSPEYMADAYEDIALPIGEGQTISQPYTVVFMLERLAVQEGQRVLDIGAGSCWQSALLAHLVGTSGVVYACEIVPSLCEFGKTNLAKYPDLHSRTKLFCKSAQDGLAEGAPFDRIIAAAEVQEVPSAWRDQLVKGGRLIYPKDGALMCEEKREDGTFDIQVFPGFLFVPFIER